MERHARSDPGRTAVVSAGETLTYGELDRRCEALAAGLRGLGLEDGDPVVLLLPSGIPSIVATIAVLKAGLVYVGMNVMLRAAEVRQVIIDCGARAAITDASLCGVAAEAAQGTTTLKHLVAFGRSSAISADVLIERPVSEPATRPVGLGARAALFYTGGTTGKPKGGIHDHANLAHWTKTASARVGLTAEDRFLCVIPTFIGSSFMPGVWTALTHGARLYLMERFDPATAVELIHDERISISWGTVAHLQRINELPYDRDLSCLRRAPFGGYSHPASLREEFESRFRARVQHAWGMSETVSTILMQPPNDEQARMSDPDSVGPPMDGVEAAILDDDGHQVAPEEPGELCLRPSAGSPWRPVLGYHRNPEETERALAGGWFHTDDLARMDRRGWVTVEGRRGDLIKVSGWAVFAKEIERVVATDPRVRAVAVTGVPDERSGQRPVAFVEPQEGSSITPEEVHALVDRDLARFKRLKDAVVLDRLPTNFYGKVSKSMLRERYLRQR
ncbi:MAG: class I adenylate-forming enzyme family protein [Solirubrobacterales bacterium]